MYAEFFNRAFGAFAGAFFAFLFLRLAEGLKSLYDRKVRHHHGLIKLEYQGNMLLDAIGLNRYEIDQIVASFDAGQVSGDIIFTTNRPVPFDFDAGVMYDLTNLDIINQVLSYRLQINRFNADIDGVLSMSDLFRTSFLEGNLGKENYVRNYAISVSKFKDIRAFLDAFEKTTKRLVATAVVRAQRDKPFLNKLVPFAVRTRHERSFETAVRTQLEQQEKELQATRDRSRHEIQEVMERRGAESAGS